MTIRVCPDGHCKHNDDGLPPDKEAMLRALGWKGEGMMYHCPFCGKELVEETTECQ